MLATTGPELWCYRQPDKKGTVRTAKKTREGEDTGKGEVLVCGRCGAPITDKKARIDVNEQHEHYFVNPHGYDYRIGCFAKAPGCIAFGKTSGEFTWFPGYTWQIDYCRSCSRHLGWMFRSPRHNFHGLIVDRIVEAEEPSDGGSGGSA
jgi:uncharacterized C2H2 Zn-finger protein